MNPAVKNRLTAQHNSYFVGTNLKPLDLGLPTGSRVSRVAYRVVPVKSLNVVRSKNISYKPVPTMEAKFVCLQKQVQLRLDRNQKKNNEEG